MSLKRRTNDIKPNPTVTFRNPATGQIGTTTAKIFHSIYIDKGFELVDRDNVDAPAPAPRKTREIGKSQTGSAADIAAGLGLANTGSMTFPEAAEQAKAARLAKDPKPETTPADNAGSGVANENETNANGSAITSERESNKRDRGRG